MCGCSILSKPFWPQLSVKLISYCLPSDRNRFFHVSGAQLISSAQSYNACGSIKSHKLLGFKTFVFYLNHELYLLRDHNCTCYWLCITTNIILTVVPVEPNCHSYTPECIYLADRNNPQGPFKWVLSLGEKRPRRRKRGGVERVRWGGGEEMAGRVL